MGFIASNQRDPMSQSASSSAPGPAPVLADFHFQAHEKLRYGDTDRQGHVNNAVFATFLETGRVEMLINGGADLMGPNGAFVLARLLLDYRREVNWPGEVEIGTRVASIGRSSLRLDQAVFQNGECVATGESTVVLTDVTTRRSRPFSDEARAFLERTAG
jgi:acyl-CoA thioester hydrolase